MKHCDFCDEPAVTVLEIRPADFPEYHLVCEDHEIEAYAAYEIFGRYDIDRWQPHDGPGIPSVEDDDVIHEWRDGQNETKIGDHRLERNDVYPANRYEINQ